MKTPIFVFNSLNVKRGGLTKAVLKRANLLADHNSEVVFFTLAYQQDHKNIIEKLYESGQMDRRIKVRNFYAELLDTELVTEPVQMPVELPGYSHIVDKKSKLPAYRYYNNGLYEQYRRFEKDGSLKLIDYMDESRTRQRREEYLRNNRLIRTSHMDITNNKPKLHRYFHADGTCKIAVWLDESGEEVKTILFDQNKEFAKVQHAYAYWIEEAVKSYESPVLLSDSRKTDETVLRVQGDVEKVGVAHSSHIASPYKDDSDTKITWHTFFEGIDDYDKVVVLTEHQKQDIISRYRVNPDKLHVIPHAAPSTAPATGESMDPHLAVALSRYSEEKAVDEGIRAFRHVVDKLPDARYHIYGFGPLESQLQKLIDELRLQDNVKLMGFTTDPAAAYQSAACSILTSNYEGFGMVLTESMAAGTPAISYDMKYGPREIIRDGVDGFIVEAGDQKLLADRILSIMEDSELRREMAGKAIEITERFSEKDYDQSWIELFSSQSKPENKKKKSLFGFMKK
ncbi:poly(glycerol-phosphate) alpha-glucosyltransferase [Terribacillus halophilus]|uniref:Poly(Glycerol-phosphate) alpha-glucosyltransferase n=1 Tax=Terribacillus halophilus TaxID=361279 RepID=A0A1G6IIP0_9BACI|nr:glycosyltransferase [Terribacillus halophilus]SDC05596.1 poly(glycerol-phosphate) alpha-glucosyltransferase [Terribacillus halophilus]